MRIECQACNTRFKLDDDLVKKDGTKVRCSKCKEIITVYPQTEKETASNSESTPSQSKPDSNTQEAQSPTNQDNDIKDSGNESRQSAPRLLILLTILGIMASGSIAYFFQYLDIYAVVLISIFFCGLLWHQLHNIFASIWLKIDSPFRQGELICVENLVQGYVIQTNYFMTRLRTDSSAIITIPNYELIRHKIINYSIHPESLPLSCDVQVDIQNSPDRVRKILLDAALPVKGVSNKLEPYTSLNGLSGNGLSNYTLFFYLDNYDQKTKSMEEIWDRIWRLFKRAGILPFKTITSEDDEESNETILEQIDIFRPFTDYAKSYMSKNMNRCHVAPGSYVFNQGDEGNSLFIIEEGVVAVQVEITPGKSIEVARLGAGSFFGEMALLTGEARTASIIAISDSILFEITREHIAPLIDEQPQISNALSELLVQRKIATEAEKNKYRAEKINRKALKKQIMEQIDSYFKEYNKTL